MTTFTIISILAIIITILLVMLEPREALPLLVFTPTIIVFFALILGLQSRTSEVEIYEYHKFSDGEVSVNVDGNVKNFSDAYTYLNIGTKPLIKTNYYNYFGYKLSSDYELKR